MTGKQGFKLLDSGENSRLEVVGERTISRPSSIAIWAREHQKLWQAVDSTFIPQEGWRGNTTNWVVEVLGVKLELRTQNNGQIGFFPEHVALLGQIDKVTKNGNNKLSALNLFAYTGLASIYALQRQFEVTHVELSKKILDWANDNINLNSIDRSLVRLIPEDAFNFLKRLIKRQQKFDLVIADPPSFSRIDKKESWQLEDRLVELVDLLAQVSSNTLILSCHIPALGSTGLKNIALDKFQNAKSIEEINLELKQDNSRKVLPAGAAVVVKV